MSRPAAPLPDLTETEVIYLAGLLDGEGCISIDRSGDKRSPGRVYHSLRVTITNTDPRLIAWLKEKLDTSASMTTSAANLRLGRRPVFQVGVRSRKAATLLSRVRPYLIVKAEQADVALAFQQLIQPQSKNWMGAPNNPEREDKRLQLIAIRREA